MKNKETSGVSARYLIGWSTGRANFSRRLAYLMSLLFLGAYFHAVALPAQTLAGSSVTPPRFSARIIFEDGASVRVRSNREKCRAVGIFPGETVTIELQLPARFANTAVAVQALDGGAVTEDVAIAADGTAAIAFRAGVQPGLYRVLLSARGRSAMLQFWVANQDNPAANPPVIDPAVDAN